jgi:hypothetical protein
MRNGDTFGAGHPQSDTDICSPCRPRHATARNPDPIRPVLCTTLRIVPAGLLRQLRASEITCPAGEVLGDASCYCSIEESIIDGHLNPESIEHYCGGEYGVLPGYTQCPTWRYAKEAGWAGVPIELEPNRPASLGDVERHFSKSVDPAVLRKNDAIEQAFNADPERARAEGGVVAFDPEFG